MARPSLQSSPGCALSSGGGTLIHPSVVLTAAHTVAWTEWSLKVRAGEWDTQSIKEPVRDADGTTQKALASVRPVTWMARPSLQSSPGCALSSGGGTLIHPSVVLTAAHTVAWTEWSLKVRAGEWDTQSIKEPYPYQDRDVARSEMHKDFNNGNLFYDISLLFLSEPMDLAPNVQLACLPPPRVKPSAGTRCFATGWGKDRFSKTGHYHVILKKVELPVVDYYTCQEQLRKTRLGAFFELHSSFMCAGGEKDRDTCKGDGGSPLSCPIEDEPGRFAQTGIVAWGIGCGDNGTPGVYVDVANLRNWIDDKVISKGYDTTVYSY
ncbi:Serine protease [Operophtera brumata]|uniref:Phenoloxidase-activating factor 2 n=1 Tax=Operophtera brumata TaxID=104452 RepID=A0A0L7KQG0_OPEBR|nr:Serine protease [Operophtera brumata]